METDVECLNEAVIAKSYALYEEIQRPLTLDQIKKCHDVAGEVRRMLTDLAAKTGELSSMG